MDSKFNNIFKEGMPISNQEMQAYLSGRLSPSEMHKIELKLESSEMNMEAFEGFRENPGAFEDLENINEKFEAKLKARKSWTSSHTLIAAGIAGLLVIAGGYLLNKGVGVENKSLITEETSKRETHHPDQVHFIISEPIVITEEIEKEVEEAEELPQSEQLTAEYVEMNQPLTVEAGPDVSNDELDSLVQTVIVPEPLSPIITEIPNEFESEKVVRSNIKVVYMHNFLVVDYSELYSEGIQSQIIQHDLHNGTPVWLENRDDQVNDVNADPIIQVVKVDYLKFVKKAQLKFKQNEYKRALKDYHNILKQYPQDVNALFYGGLCYYNLNKPERALLYFENLIHNSVNSFRQEGQFYKALSLIAMNKHGQGNGILLKIAEEEGFYSQQAQDLLNNQ